MVLTLYANLKGYLEFEASRRRDAEIGEMIILNFSAYIQVARAWAFSGNTRKI